MSARLLHAPLLLLLWQVAPIDVPSTGKLRVALGIGGGRLTSTTVSGSGVGCNGEPITVSEEVPDRYSSAGVSVEAGLKPGVRLVAAGGVIRDGSRQIEGPFGALQVVLEREKFAIGGGLATVGGEARTVSPSLLVRAGGANLQFRADYRYPEATFGVTGWPRIGLELNGGNPGKVRVFGGVGFTPVYRERRRSGVFMDVLIPVGPEIDNHAGLSLHAFLGDRRQRLTPRTFGAGFWIQP
jgi:hypothetical protein